MIRHLGNGSGVMRTTSTMELPHAYPIVLHGLPYSFSVGKSTHITEPRLGEKLGHPSVAQEMTNGRRCDLSIEHCCRAI